MKRAVSMLWLTGCFYVNPINERPSVDIHAESSDPVFRGDEVTLEAVAIDPEGERVTFGWRIYACTDATTSSSCDPEPMFTGTEALAEFVVPQFRADASTPVESLRVILDAHDERGAIAKPPQELVMPVLDRAPKLRIDVDHNQYDFVVGTPVNVYAKFSDADDTAANVELTWTFFSPTQVPIMLTDLPPITDPDPAVRQLGKQLLTNAVGQWEVRVVASDTKNMTEDSETFTVKPDAPPCLDGYAPALPTQGAHLSVFDPTLFQVLVTDDLDAYPPRDAMNPIYKTPTFTWSIGPQGGPREVIPGATGNSVVFDPALYTPGTLVEVRVEIADRNTTPITCADDVPACSVISTSCYQRQTWLVEAR